MSLPAVGRPRSRNGRQSSESSQKSCMKADTREKLPNADGNKLPRRQTLAPICNPGSKSSIGAPKPFQVDSQHQRQQIVCSKTGLSQPTIKNVCDLPNTSQFSKRSAVGSDSVLGRTKLDKRQTPEKCSTGFGSVAHGFSKDVLSSSDEDELFRQYLADQGHSSGHTNRLQNPSEFSSDNGKRIHSTASCKMSQRELELIHYQRALLEQMLDTSETENYKDMKGTTGKKSNKKNCKKGRDKKTDVQFLPSQPLTEHGHKFEDLPVLRQTRLRVSMDPDAAVPEEAQYIPTPPGSEKIPCRLVPNMSAGASPGPRKVRFNIEERGAQRRD
ncbi:uncharacterized protein [Argopecten irradians]|uniref:uncharacterized protein n=1 Tax=Argopecten irradians TaxID=31199 RepID=UPI003711500A